MEALVVVGVLEQEPEALEIFQHLDILLRCQYRGHQVVCTEATRQIQIQVLRKMECSAGPLRIHYPYIFLLFKVGAVDT